MANEIDLADALRRFCALEKEALATLMTAAGTPVQCEAFPRWFVKNETFPYWVNRIGSIQAVDNPSEDYGEEFNTYYYTVVSRLVVAHITADYVGEVDEAIAIYVPIVIAYLDARELLQSAAYPVAATNLRFASFQTGSGYMTFPKSVGGVEQVGAEFVWRLEFDQDVNQAYL